MKRFLAQAWRTLHLPKNIQLIIMRLFQDAFLVGVSGIIFNENNEILLFHHTYRSIPWGLPGGYLKAKEHPKEGLEREIFEESGLVISVDERFRIRTDRDTARLDITYIGKFIGGEFTPSHEVSEYKFFRFDELPQVRKDQLLLVDKAISIKSKNTV